MNRFQETINELNDFMIIHCKSKRVTLDAAVTDLVNGGGKRLRPILLMLAGNFGENDSEKLFSLAAAVELLHMATLVHDDIIDEARLRRGELTAQEKFGKKVAVFVGDYLLTKSYTLFAKYLSEHSLSKLNKIVKLICVGEIDQFEEKYEIDLSLIDYMKRIRRKTALLFAISSYIGAYESGVRGKLLYNLYSFALEMGMTFQIQDDLLDFTGSELKTGKKIGQDLAAGIYTLPVIYLMKKSDYSQETKKLLSKDVMNAEDINKISEMVIESGAVDESKLLASKFLKKAKENLDNLPDIKAKEDLKYILDRQLKRQF